MLWIGKAPRVNSKPYPIRALRARLARMQLDLSFGPRPHFDGATYEAAQDQGRLRRQLEAVNRVMADGAWRTLAELAALTGYPEASVSARLRDLRKPKFGGWTVDRERVSGGLFRYRVKA